MILVDTNVLLDIYKADPVWMPWSVRQLRSAKSGQLAINMVVYAELAGHPAIPQRIDKFLDTLGIEVLDLTRPAAKLAGLAFRQYRQSGGTKTGVLPDFSLALMPKQKNSNYSRVIQGAIKPTFPTSN